MIYVDTSVIVKLYIREEHSREASEWLRKNNEAIPLSFDERQLKLASAAGLLSQTFAVGEEKFRIASPPDPSVGIQ
jgi:predicted nucleic acid-binding protein